jgi:hypothetical protein
VFTRLLKAKPKRTDIVPKSNNKKRSGNATNAFLHNVVGKCEHFKNIDYAGYTERLILQARHLNTLLSFERLGRLMDSEIMGTTNYKHWICWVIKEFEETSLGSNMFIYRRNLQRAYIERMSYLMKENKIRTSV